MALVTEAFLWKEVPADWYRAAVWEVLRIVDDAPESRWTRRIREVLRRPRRIGGRGTFARLSPDEDAERAQVYSLGLTDRKSGRVLGISGQAYQRWRRSRGLPPWRRRGERAGPPRSRRQDPRARDRSLLADEVLGAALEITAAPGA